MHPHTRRDEASYSQRLVLVCSTEHTHVYTHTYTCTYTHAHTRVHTHTHTEERSTSDRHSLLLSRETRCDFLSFLHFLCSFSKLSTRGWFNQKDREHKQIFKTSAQPQSEGCNRLKPFSIKNTTVQRSGVTSNRKKDSLGFPMSWARARTGAPQLPDDNPRRILPQGSSAHLTHSPHPPPFL